MRVKKTQLGEEKIIQRLEMYQLIFDSIYNGAMVTDADGVITHFNKPYGQFLGVDPEVAVDTDQRPGRWDTRSLVGAAVAAAALLLVRLLDSDEVATWQEALQGTVAAAVAMVPDGLVLLTSLAFIVGIIALARRQIYAFEEARARGEGVAVVDGRIVENLHVVTAKEILAKADAIAALEG